MLEILQHVFFCLCMSQVLGTSSSPFIDKWLTLLAKVNSAFRCLTILSSECHIILTIRAPISSRYTWVSRKSQPSHYTKRLKFYFILRQKVNIACDSYTSVYRSNMKWYLACSHKHTAQSKIRKSSGNNNVANNVVKYLTFFFCFAFVVLAQKIKAVSCYLNFWRQFAFL